MPKILRSALFMAAVCAVCTAVPAAVRAATARRVATLERLATFRNVLEALSFPVHGVERTALEASFASRVREEHIDGRPFWFGISPPSEGVVAFPVRGPGFWGPIHGIVAVREDDFTIVSVLFTKHEETPGLGGRIAEPWFTSQFRGITLNPSRDGPLVRLVRPGARERPSDVDAITGATETSKKIQHLFDTDVRQALLSLARARAS